MPDVTSLHWQHNIGDKSMTTLCHRCQIIQQIEADLAELESLFSLNMSDADRFNRSDRLGLDVDLARWQEKPCTCSEKEPTVP